MGEYIEHKLRLLAEHERNIQKNIQFKNEILKKNRMKGYIIEDESINVRLL